MSNFTYYVYILELSDGRLYTGITNDLSRRFLEHQIGKSGTRTTKIFGAVSIIYTEKHPDRASALKREHQVKRWSGAKKRALAGGDIKTLKSLAKRRT